VAGPGALIRPSSVPAAPFPCFARSGETDLVHQAGNGFIVEPDLDLYKFQSTDKSPANYSRYNDKALDELFIKQGRSGDMEERKRYIREFEKRLLDEEAHYLYTLQWNRIIPHNSKVRNWTITPSHYLNDQLDAVWLAE